jgi:hypothetical protein
MIQWYCLVCGTNTKIGGGPLGLKPCTCIIKVDIENIKLALLDVEYGMILFSSRVSSYNDVLSIVVR